MIKSNYHTHVLYCNHASGYAIDYVKKAVELNFFEIGITDHAPIKDDFMNKEDYDKNWCYQNMKYETIPQYLKDIEEAKEKYKDKINVLSGFESEFLPEQINFYKELRSKVDYLNLGVHYFKYNNKIYNTYSEIDYNSVYGYAKACIEGMQSGLFNTLVHPDLFMFSYKNINGERKMDAAAIDVAHKILSTAEKLGVYVEVNANGLKNSVTFGNGDWLYPCRDFWLIAKEYKNLKILIGADAHEVEALGNENIEKVCQFVKEIGLNIVNKMEICK